jgi:hypothetical protein
LEGDAVSSTFEVTVDLGMGDQALAVDYRFDDRPTVDDLRSALHDARDAPELIESESVSSFHLPHGWPEGSTAASPATEAES